MCPDGRNIIFHALEVFVGDVNSFIAVDQRCTTNGFRRDDGIAPALVDEFELADLVRVLETC